MLCQTPVCRPHESAKHGIAALSWRGSVRQPHDRDSAQLAGIGRYCRCLPMPRFLVCAVLPRDLRITTISPLTLSLSLKSRNRPSPPSPFRKKTSCGSLSRERRKSLEVHTFVAHGSSLVFSSLSPALRPGRRPTLHCVFTTHTVGSRRVRPLAFDPREPQASRPLGRQEQ